MKNFLPPFLVAAFTFFFWSCAGQSPLLNTAIVTEAGTLKNFCEQKSIQSVEITKADSFFTDGNIMLKKGKKEEAYREMDLAAIYYRLALSKRDLEETRKSVEDLARQLVDTDQLLNTYKQVLDQIKTGGGK